MICFGNNKSLELALDQNKIYYSPTVNEKLGTLRVKKISCGHKFTAFLDCIIAIVILVIYTAFQIETIHVTIKSPSIETFEKLQMNYANVLKCPCSQIAVKYQRFIHMQPIYHQVIMII